MEEFLFADEVEEIEVESKPRWKVLIVDDEPEVHNITQLVLNDFSFEHARLDLKSAYSAAEAREILASPEGEEIAVAVIDVVMESNHAGLDLIRWIRESLRNHKIRLVLRTGQPGEAPEEKVIHNYDINDYKNKTELTALKLKTLFYSALRSYRDIVTIERHRQGLEKIIGATTEFIACDNLNQFASAILKQVSLVLGLESSEVICCAASKKSEEHPAEMTVLAMSGSDISVQNPANYSTLPAVTRKRLDEALTAKASIYQTEHFIGYFTTRRGTENVFYVAQEHHLKRYQHQLLEFFANNIAVAYENLRLRELIKDSQRELSYVIGEAVELRSRETGSHVKRVAHVSYLLATLYGLPEYEAEMIKLASPLHDVGKVAIPDGILNKPGKHTQEEWSVMRQHAEIGYDMLKKSDNPILQLGATIALQHHEKWNGEGYPQGLEKKDIHIAGRISALADVFDALGSKRCYKQAWSEKEIIDLIRQQRGEHFEPELVDLMLDNIDQFTAIRKKYPDGELHV